MSDADQSKPDKPILIVSYGGGVQSSAIILMSIAGELEKPDAVLFSDTGSESQETYQTVKWMADQCEQAEIPFFTAYADFRAGYDDDPEHIKGYAPLHEWYLHYARLPMVGNPRCTYNFKIYPFRRMAKKLANTKLPKPYVRTWLGITTDEAHRARESEMKWISSEYPLIEKDLSRRQCITWLEKHYPEQQFSKSGCWLCPYQSGRKWAKLRKEEPDLFRFARKMEIKASENGVRRGLWGARSILAFDSDMTLEDFGVEFQPGDFDCDAEGGCFL